MNKKVCIVIPAYNPTEYLEQLVNELTQNDYESIIVVNDGSVQKTNKYFENIKKHCIILKHKENLGKGQSIKTGIKYYIKNYKNLNGILTVDADGQHNIKDINNVCNKFINTNELVLGIRNFKQKQVPIKSKIGNTIINKIFNIKTKYKLQDTQTGLRAIPNRYMKSLLEIKGNRFEYETNMLIFFAKNKEKILEVPIETIYYEKNKNTSFKSIIDSIKIIKLFIEKEN